MGRSVLWPGVDFVFTALVLARLQLSLAGNVHNCIANTGGTCSIENCASWRGSTTCDGMRCFCAGGTCAGVDQVCYETSHANVPYTRMASGQENVYEIQNARWPNYFLYVQLSGAVWASTDHDGETSDFTMVKPPQNSGASNAYSPPSYLIYSKEWSDAALYVYRTGSGDDETYAPTCQNIKGSLGGLGNDPPITQLAMTLTKAPVEVPPEMVAKNQSLIMLSSPLYPDRYIYLSKMSWDAKAYKGDPGAGGYWYIKTLSSTPLPKDILDAMPAYTGPRCSSFCGVAVAMARSYRSLSLAIFVGLWAMSALHLQEW